MIGLSAQGARMRSGPAMSRLSLSNPSSLALCRNGIMPMEGGMSKIAVMCARSMHAVAGALGQAFAARGSHELAFDFGTVGGLQAKLDAGATADVVILSVPGIDRMEAAGLLVAGS